MPSGRDPKLTPDVQAVILRAIAAGVPRKYAAESAGVTDRTLRNWLAWGRQRKRSGVDYVSFLSALKKAEADAVAVRVARIARAGQGGHVVERTTVTTTKADGSSTTRTTEKLAPGQWTADAWYLERQHPEEFASDAREIRQLRKELDELKEHLLKQVAQS